MRNYNINFASPYDGFQVDQNLLKIILLITFYCKTHYKQIINNIIIIVIVIALIVMCALGTL